MAKKNPNERRYIELNRKPLHLCKLLNGLEIREAARALEKMRLLLNEEEILLGAKLRIHMTSYSNPCLIAERLETDNEYSARLEEKRRQEQERIRAAKLREERAEARKIKEAVKQRQKALDAIKALAAENSLSDHELETLFKK